jgi:hypothetical protein
MFSEKQAKLKIIVFFDKTIGACTERGPKNIHHFVSTRVEQGYRKIQKKQGETKQSDEFECMMVKTCYSGKYRTRI